MRRNKITSDRLKELRKQMAIKFEFSFGHDLTDQEREQNWKGYQNLRNEYLSEYQKLNDLVRLEDYYKIDSTTKES